MRRPLLAAVLGVLAVACAPGTATATIIPPSAVNAIGGGPQTITFLSFAYSPASIAVAPGPLTWSGSLASHPLTFDDGSPGGSSGTSFQRTMAPGVVRFYCGIHGGRNGFGMSGVAYVAGPAAALKATPAAPTAAGTVTLDASGTDFVDTSENSTATYAFDVDDDGTFETTGGAPTTTATFPLGTRTARVRVTDDDGRTGEATVTVRVGEQPATGTPGGGGGGAGGGPAPADGGGGGGAIADPGAPTLRPASAQRVTPGALLRGPVTLRPGTLSERATVRASLRLRGKVLGKAAATTVGAGPLRVTVRLSAAGRRAVRGLRSATLTLRLELTDAAGNRRVVERPVRLRR